MNKIFKTFGAVALLSFAAQPVIAATCADSLQKWQEEALKDGKLLSSIFTGKRMEKARGYAAAKDEAACMNEEGARRPDGQGEVLRVLQVLTARIRGRHLPHLQADRAHGGHDRSGDVRRAARV